MATLSAGRARLRITKSEMPKRSTLHACKSAKRSASFESANTPLISGFHGDFERISERLVVAGLVPNHLIKYCIL